MNDAIDNLFYFIQQYYERRIFFAFFYFALLKHMEISETQRPSSKCHLNVTRTICKIRQFESQSSSTFEPVIYQIKNLQITL